MNSPSRSPVVIELTRAHGVESSHIVDIVISDRSRVHESWGEPDRPVIARSAIKSVQALPLITTGAADAFDVSDDELALACSSHSAEAHHVKLVRAWLARLSLGEDDLECGPGRPIGQEAAADAIRAGCAAASILNCCSGKHTGFLTTAVHLGEQTTGYVDRHHPVQQRVEQAVGLMTGVDLHSEEGGIDGCGIPVFALPLRRLALAMARLVDPVDLDDVTAAACRRLTALLPSRTQLTSGAGQSEPQLAAAAAETVILKGGAEGVFMAALPDRGIGIALKVRDGAERAADEAIWGLLDQLGAMKSPTPDHPVLNKAGREVGVCRAVFPR